jgi:hypothetical protein
MPILTANLSPDVFGRIMHLVADGIYLTPEQFLAVAAYNQLVLEQGTPVAELRGPSLPAQAGSRSESAGVKSRAAVNTGKPDRSFLAASEPAAVPRKAELATGELQAALTRLDIRKCETLALECHPASEAHSDRIWGQVNRLFPMKLVCRWVAVAAVQRASWPDLQTVLHQLPADAAIMGTELERLDHKLKRSRDEAHATGLPRVGNLASCDRFISQFVARVTRANQVYPGAIFQFQLAGLGGREVQLTERGRELALMPNPILESGTETACETLSEQERAFLLRHVMESVPTESNELMIVLRAIRDGHKTPNGLRSYIRNHFPAEWSDLAFRTHIYGVLARLTDLAQIQKIRTGRTVQYDLPDSAHLLLSEPR